MTANFARNAIEEVDIWRAAQQMLKLYPEGAEIAASMRADKALAQGDMFNFDVWKRIAKAVKMLERQKPERDELFN